MPNNAMMQASILETTTMTMAFCFSRKDYVRSRRGYPVETLSNST